MPAQPAEREPEEEMEADGESQLPEANGEVEEPKDAERTVVGEEEMIEESVEERDSDMEESEEVEEEEEESSGRKSCGRKNAWMKPLLVWNMSLSEEMDDEDCERRRGECLDEMMDLEKQFQELKEK